MARALDLKPAGLRIVVHIANSKSGLKATLDSPDQNAAGIPVSSISLAGSTVKFASLEVHGAFEGKLSADGNTIEGTWTQGQPLPLTLSRAAKSDLDGAWSGTLDAGQKLRLMFHIASTAAGLTATLDSLDQSAKGIPISKVTRKGSSVVMECDAVGGKFEGELSKDGTTLTGSWSQGGGTLPLVLKHGPDTIARHPSARKTPSSRIPITKLRSSSPIARQALRWPARSRFRRAKLPFRPWC